MNHMDYNNIVYNMLPNDFKPLPVYLHTVSDYFNESLSPTRAVYRPQGLGFSQILLVINGEGVLHCQNRTYPLKAGCAFYTRFDVPVTYYGNEAFTTAFLTAKGDGTALLDQHFGYDGFLFRELVDTQKLLEEIRFITDEYYTYKRESILSSLTYSFFIDFLEPPSDRDDTIRNIALYIEKNFTKKLTLQKIADRYGISVSKLCHDFKDELGYTVFEYILNLKLNYARNFIFNYPSTKTKDLALRCGFDDVSYFCKAYKAKFGITPSKDKR